MFIHSALHRRPVRVGVIGLAGAAIALVTHPAPARAQLSLRDAFATAERAAYANRIAEAGADGQRAQALAPLRGILPSLHFEAGYVRTTDPIGVFGSTLRQRAVSPANFDPQRLNYPDAVTNYTGGIVVEQPIFNGDAWTGRRAATYAADAGRASAEWTRINTRVDVVSAYYGAVLATERVNTLEAAARAAHAHVDQAQSMVRQGLVTKSDALLASVRAGDVDAELADALGNAAIARRQLAVLLGRAEGDLPDGLAPPGRLPSSDRIRAAVAPDTAVLIPQPRADLDAARAGVAAADADALRARAAYLPRLNSFARYDWNSAARLYGGDRNWSVGVMASWTPFAGASELSDIAASAARERSARAQSEAARANAKLQLEATRSALAVALTRLDIAERGAEQSAEAHRIVARKYDGGLATVVELLDAQAVETQGALAFSQARWGAIIADADRRRALGLDPATLASLDDAGAVAATLPSAAR